MKCDDHLQHSLDDAMSIAVPIGSSTLGAEWWVMAWGFYKSRKHSMSRVNAPCIHASHPMGWPVKPRRKHGQKGVRCR